VLLFAIASGMLTGIGFGLLPVLRSQRFQLQKALQESGARSTASRAQIHLRRVFVVLQTALAVTLLIEGTLLVESLAKVYHLRPALVTNQILTFYVSLPPSRYSVRELAAGTARLDSMLKAVQSLPGVNSAAMASDLPLSGTAPGNGILLEGRNLPQQFWSAPFVIAAEVSPDYFRSLGIPLLAGRQFTDRERLEKVVLINSTLARQFFQGENAVGKRIALASDNPRWQQIIGVADDVPQAGMEQKIAPEIFFPLTVPVVPWVAFAARVQGRPAQYIEPLRARIASVDPSVAVFLPRTMQQMMEEQTLWRSLQTWLVGAFSFIAVILASVGIYAVLAHSVRQRTAEIGLRMALGASQAQMLRSILLQGMQPALIGIAAGLLCGFAAARLTTRLLFATRAADPLAYLLAAAFVLTVALLASFLPALRASRIEPARALRHE
jgi:putative ABC transport system permease protein